MILSLAPVFLSCPASPTGDGTLLYAGVSGNCKGALLAFPHAWLVFFSLTAWGLLATLSRVFMVGVLLKGLSPYDSEFSVF